MTKIRTDVIDAYLFRRTAKIELLQLRRVDPPLSGTWQPVMGHTETGESAVVCMQRETAEETGLAPADALGVWSLEQIHPFFLAERDEIVMSPRFAVEVGPAWEPTLNDEHDAHRWVPIAEATKHFLWPGQHAAIAEIRSMLRTPARADALRLPGV